MPHQPVPEEKRRFARHLRREITEAEDRLWQELRGRRLDGIKFRRQVPVGRYVADFLCAEATLIVEVDGSQHAKTRSFSLEVLDIYMQSLYIRGYRSGLIVSVS